MAVYLYRPPTYRTKPTRLGGTGTTISTTVYRKDGVWFNVAGPGLDEPDLSVVDVDARTNLRLYFGKPTVIPGSLYDELAALEPGGEDWTDGELVLL